MSRNWIETRKVVFFVFGHFFSQATLSNPKKTVFLLQLYVFELIFSFSTISFLLCEFTYSFLIHLQLVFYEICIFSCELSVFSHKFVFFFTTDFLLFFLNCEFTFHFLDNFPPIFCNFNVNFHFFSSWICLFCFPKNLFRL